MEHIGWENICISIVTAAEVYYGARNKKELTKLRKFMAQLQVLHLNEEISKVSHGIVLSYTLSHNAGIQDALIAATAMACGLPLYTENLKDFDFIPGLSIYHPPK